MKSARKATDTPTRVARHRKKMMAGGARRVEVTVPTEDAPLVKALAEALRAGGDDAGRARAALRPLLTPARARTGEALVAFLRASPLVGAELEIERDQSTGRLADLG